MRWRAYLMPCLSWGQLKDWDKGLAWAVYFGKVSGNIRGSTSKGMMTKRKKESQPKNKLLSRLPWWTTGAHSVQGPLRNCWVCLGVFHLGHGEGNIYPLAPVGCWSRVLQGWNALTLPGSYLCWKGCLRSLPATSSYWEESDPSAVRRGHTCSDKQLHALKRWPERMWHQHKQSLTPLLPFQHQRDFIKRRLFPILWSSEIPWRCWDVTVGSPCSFVKLWGTGTSWYWLVYIATGKGFEIIYL